MRPIDTSTHKTPSEQTPAPAPGVPTDREQQQFSDMMRQKQREADPRGGSERSPMELYPRREERGESQGGSDHWDPDMPLDNPTDAQMDMMQKMQRNKRERLERRQEDQQRQPARDEQAAGSEQQPKNDGGAKAFGGGERTLSPFAQQPSGQTPDNGQNTAFQRNSGDTALAGNAQSQTQNQGAAADAMPQSDIAAQPGSTQAKPTPSPAPRADATTFGNQTGPDAGNPAPSGQPGGMPHPAGAEVTQSQQQLLWQNMAPTKQAPTLGNPLPEGAPKQAGDNPSAPLGADTTRLSGEHILGTLQRRQGDGNQGGGQGGGKGGKASEAVGENGFATPQNAGEAILGMLQQNHSATGEVSAAQAPKAAQMVSDIADKIVDRILVSDAASMGKDEVRLILKNSVLPETEVRITREGGNLEIQLVTKDTDAYRLLNDRTDNLQHFLKEKLKDNDINVRLQFAEGSERGENQRDQDGRSRQQRNLYDEMQEEPQD
ncbi:type III secretion HpaP family protein [Acanthopleuribacter pedis]|uniref:Flagellar hook-length control protein-like C-terminal domain-containing protein n=1 Tax=Acanthopleuribacter pedis TaxID=442870 RepID=A0A8J7Q8R3_9BACT|nr:type III secretion HpaP family protein [Acanthopleuribacter pedis]MBO1322597.1 hypothetical protein [Acanthopleuribacter pedis]